MNYRISTALLLSAALAAPNAQAAAGFIQFVNGEARVILARGGEQAAQKGVELNEGDTLVTSRGATVQLRMNDEGLIAVRPDSQLRIDTYQYFGREDGSERGILALARGGFRTLTGFIGRNNKSNYLVRTPNATIGIRGTDHEVVHIPALAPGESPIGVPGTYNKVNVGETFMETKAGRIDLGPNQIGFAALLVVAPPVRLDSVPPFLRATPQQQGRDDRRQVRESSPNDQRRIAQLSGQPGPGSAGAKPGPTPPPGTRQQPGQPAQPGTPQQIGQPQPALLQVAGFQSLPPPQPAATPINTVDKGIGYAESTQGLRMAPDRYVGVGGDRSASTGVGSGGLIQGESGSVFFGQDGQLALITRPNGFSYARSGAPNVAPGNATLSDGTAIQWGVYAGGGIVDSSGSRAVHFFHFMSAQGTPLAGVNTLTGTYNTVLGQNKLITENGLLGGTVTSVNIAVNTGRLTTYSVQAVDAQARNWAGNCSGCAGGIPLSEFAASGVNLAGTGPGGSASGKAQGAPIGPTGLGMVSSFNLKTTGGQGVTGSFVAK